MSASMVIIDSGEGVEYTHLYTDVQEEVFKRTSLIARGENAALYDKLVLSKAEDFIFAPYISSVAAELFDFIYPFCRDSLQGVGYVEPDDAGKYGMFDADETGQLAVRYVTKKLHWFDANAINIVDRAMFEALVNGVIAQYLSIEGATNMAQRYNELYERSVVNMRNRLNAQKKPLRRGYRLF